MFDLKKIFLILLITTQVGLFSSEYSIEEPGSWVLDVSWDKDAPLPEHVNNGEYYRLYEDQVLLDKNNVSRFRRFVIELTDIKSVEGNSQLSIDFDPSYEALKVHSVEIIRGNEIIDKLSDADVQVIQRETDMDALLYDGSKTFNAILKDIRPGDILDYSFTIEGLNPIFDDKFSEDYNLEWSVPVGNTYLRVVNRKEVDLYFNYLNREYEPEVVKNGSIEEYIWQVTTKDTLTWDSSTPSWYFPLSRLEISEFKSWSEFKKWAYKLFDQDYDKEDIKTLFKEIAGTSRNKEEIVFNIINWVQDEVRYLGLESGVASYKPTTPDKTLKRRFGDCKDKSFLTIALLEQAGVEAWPVLVNTRYGVELHKSIPLTGLFNHAIIAFKLDGELTWVDPTDNFQGGESEGFNQPNYFNALILDRKRSTFISMDSGPLEEPNYEVFYDFDLSSDPAAFSVTSNNRFNSADYQRSKFKRDGKSQIQDEYLNFYTSYYPGIEVEKEMELSDNVKSNVFNIKESYFINNIWSINEESGEKSVNLYPIDLSIYINLPRDIRRTMPIALSYPLYISQTIRAKYDETQGVFDSDSFSLKSEYIEFSFVSNFKNQILTNKFEFKTLKESVPVEHIEDYMADINTILDKLDYSYYSKFEKQGEPQAVEIDTPEIKTPSRLFSIIAISIVLTLMVLGLVRENRIRERQSKKIPQIEGLD